MERKHIAVLGAGFGGITAAIRIAKGLRRKGLLDTYEVILVDRNDYQIYTPNLYAYAAAPRSVDLGRVTRKITSIIGSLPITFMRGEIKNVDLAHGDIHLATGEEMKADFVVIALGSEVNDFNIPGVRENTISLKTFADAERIRDTVIGLLGEKASPKIIIGGAGANGIEIAAEIKNVHPTCMVTIVEAMATVLPGLDPRVAGAAAARLKKLGVEIALNAKIARVEKEQVILDGAPALDFDLMIWTAGVKAPPIVTSLPLRTDRGKPVSDGDMLCVPQTPDLKLFPMVYATGDSVCFMDPATSRPMPAVAPVAIDQGKIAAWNVLEDIIKAEKPDRPVRTKHYAPQAYPYVIVAGGRWAVAKAGPFIFKGFSGWLFKEIIELDYRLSLH